MNKAVKVFKSLTPLKVPVPPMLGIAIGYKGEARFVSFQWTPYGDEADYSNGQISAIGEWQAFLAYIRHPAVSPHLRGYDFGSSDSEAKHALILDREKLELFVASVKEPERFLTEQWPPQLPLRMSREEYSALVMQALKNVQQRREIDMEEVHRRIEEQSTLIEEMQQWLDRQLKN
jgi:hypothetical protein